LKTCLELRALVLAAALLAAAMAGAQVRVGGTIRAKPLAPASEKPATFDGTVVHADAASIVVRSRANPRMIRTFSYSPEVRARIEQMLERGEDYQFGERVRIRYRPGQNVALGIRGKASKPR
jgi:hypothetical protein